MRLRRVGATSHHAPAAKEPPPQAAHRTAPHRGRWGAPTAPGTPHQPPQARKRAAGYFARSKSIAEYARNLLSRCSEVIFRTVPDLDRITIESVTAVSER